MSAFNRSGFPGFDSVVERRLAERVGLVDVRAAIDEQDGDRFVAARFGDQAIVSRGHTGDAGGGKEQRALAGRRRIFDRAPAARSRRVDSGSPSRAANRAPSSRRSRRR